MNVPETFHFTEEHEWANPEGEEVRIGISHHAQDVLGDIVYVELPRVGEAFSKDDEFGLVESVKAASSLYMPVDGEVVEINDDLQDSPELVNEAPYSDGWMIKVKPSDNNQIDELMDANTYRDFIE